jgi:hypothetical protein
MSEEIPPQQAKRSWPGASLALFILGLVILGASGLCTASLIAAFPLGILFFLLFGAVPMAAGGVLIWGALKARSRG